MSDSENTLHALQKQLNSGATSLVLLALLQQAGRAMYGYEIAKELEVRWMEELPMKQGALYPVLRSLEKQGLLSSYLEPSEAGPPRKYYQITPVGKKTLKHWIAAWENTTRFVNSILEREDESSGKGHSKLSRTTPKGVEKRSSDDGSRRRGRRGGVSAQRTA